MKGAAANERKNIKTWSTPYSREERRLVPCALCGGGGFKPRFACREGFSYVSCRRCGLVQMNPQPVPAAIAERYGREHGEEYLGYETANEGAFLNLQKYSLEDAGFFELEKTLLHRKLGKVGKILDVGCATGALLEMLTARGWKAQGVEISKPQAEYCRKRGLEVFCMPLEEGHFPDESFDVVLASHLIEHLNRPSDFVREVYRILKKGGRFFVTTPDIAGFQARVFRGRWRSAIFDHLYLFSARTLKKMLGRAGFVVERKACWGGLAAGLAPPPVKSFLDGAAKMFGFGDVMILRSVRPAGLSTTGFYGILGHEEIPVRNL
jgi:SAM-dependent methyltransferase